jgi:hypothetical protein
MVAGGERQGLGLQPLLGRAQPTLLTREGEAPDDEETDEERARDR